MKSKINCCIVSVLLLITLSTRGQDINTAPINLSEKVLSKVSSTITSLEQKFVSLSEKQLKKMDKQEARLKKKLQRIDSAAANKIFGEPSKLSQLSDRLKAKTQKLNTNKIGEFFPYADSLKTSLSFLAENKTLTQSKEIQGKVDDAIGSLNSIESQLKNIGSIQKYLKERKSYLKAELQKYGFVKQLKKLNKQVFYYNEKIKEYKSVLNDPKKMEVWAFRMLNKIPAFKTFFEKNSFVAKLFGTNSFASNSSTVPDIPGLQTRSQVQQLVNMNLISTSAGNTQNILRDRLAQVKNELGQLQSKNSSWDENAEMPDFKPNQMRSKSFLKKLEFGTNLQFNKPTGALPSTANIAGQVAYRFHQNGSFGFGMAYKLGYGSFRQISFSNQGLGLRSFLDYKLKGKVFVNGGFEFNYNTAFDKLDQLKNYSAWQSSALIGLSKKYKISSKLKGNIVLLYDFLYRQHIPNSQPFVFRLGYNF